MRLMDELRRRLEGEQSYFQQHLLREDIARLEKVAGMARVLAGVDIFLVAAKKVGWTPDDRRTHELKEVLDPLLAAIHKRVTADQGDSGVVALDDEIVALWRAFDQQRMDRFVGCLSRVPRPGEA